MDHLEPALTRYVTRPVLEPAMGIPTAHPITDTETSRTRLRMIPKNQSDGVSRDGSAEPAHMGMMSHLTIAQVSRSGVLQNQVERIRISRSSSKQIGDPGIRSMIRGIIRYATSESG